MLLELFGRQDSQLATLMSQQRNSSHMPELPARNDADAVCSRSEPE
jgi:hypothetical protein